MQSQGKLKGDGFVLYPNEPNPMLGNTKIGFWLPAASWTRLTVCDVSGRILMVKEGDFGKGFQAIFLSRDEIRGSGVLYYRLEAGGDFGVGKMVVIE